MSSLEDLVVDSREVDPDLLASMLEPFLRIDRTSAHIVPRESWNSIPTEVRVLLFLVARKAMVVLDVPVDREDAGVGEIERGAHLPAGSVRPVMKRLLKQRTVRRAEEGRYMVPNYALLRIRGFLNEWLEGPEP